MIYQLLNGKTVNIPVSLYLSLSDDEFAKEYEELMAFNFGEDSEDIWKDSVLKAPVGKKDKDQEDFIVEDVPDLLDLSIEDKLRDLDIEPMD